MIFLKLENLARRWGTASRFQNFLMATHLFLFMLTLGSTKKSCIAQKTVVSTKKIFQIEVNVVQQNYISHRKICCCNKKELCGTQKKAHVDSCLVSHRKGIRVYKKWFLLHIFYWYEFIKKVSCCTKNTLMSYKN